MIARRSFAALLFLAALAPSAAFAQVSDADRGTARELTAQGYEALAARDWATAADRLARADKLFHAPTITVGLARAHVGLGKLVAAQEEYSRVVHEPAPPNAPAAFTAAIEDAGRELAALSRRVPGVIINLKGPEGARVTLDGAEVPAAAFGVKRPADPGTHVVRAGAVGCTPAEATVTLVEGGTETVSLELKPGPGGPLPAATLGIAEPPASGAAPLPGDAGGSGSLRRTIGFVALGVGGAGLIAGAITGGLALSKHSSLEAICKDSHCPANTESTNQPLIDSYTTVGNISTAGLAAGGALAAVGVILVVTAPRAAATGYLRGGPTRSATIVPVLGAGYGGVQGRF